MKPADIINHSLYPIAQPGNYLKYVPNLWHQQDECYEVVRRVPSGDRTRSKRPALNTNDPQFLPGRNSLQKVSENRAPGVSGNFLSS